MVLGVAALSIAVLSVYPFLTWYFTHFVVSDRRVQFTDIKSLEVLAHFQTATLARIPAPIQREQELIA